MFKYYHKEKEKTKEKTVKTKKLKTLVVYRLVYNVTKNNVYITIYNPFNKIVFYSSGGLSYEFLRKKSVAVVNILLGENLGRFLLSSKIRALDIVYKSIPYKGHREGLAQGLSALGIYIRSLVDNTPISHNGCKRKKKRRKGNRVRVH